MLSSPELWCGEIRCHLSVEELFRHGESSLTPHPSVTENLVFLGEIELAVRVEQGAPLGYIYA